jgi:hypothetical protein
MLSLFFFANPKRECVVMWEWKERKAIVIIMVDGRRTTRCVLWLGRSVCEFDVVVVVGNVTGLWF